MWHGLQAGSLQVVATDHAAFSTEQKRMGVDDFTKIPNGSNGLEERLSVLWTRGVETGRLTPNEFVAVTSTNVAKILNIYPKKGAIVEGADADITVWDPKISKTISASNHHSILDYNVFEGFEVTANAALHDQPGRGDLGLGPQQPAAARTRPLRAAPGLPLGASGAVEVEGTDRAQADPPRSDEHPGGDLISRGKPSCSGRAPGRCIARIRGEPGQPKGKNLGQETVIKADKLNLVFETSGGPIHALKDVDLEIGKGEFVSFIGPSGCGKTTFLRCIAALEQPTGGS